MEAFDQSSGFSHFGRNNRVREENMRQDLEVAGAHFDGDNESGYIHHQSTTRDDELSRAHGVDATDFLLYDPSTDPQLDAAPYGDDSANLDRPLPQVLEELDGPTTASYNFEVSTRAPEAHRLEQLLISVETNLNTDSTVSRTTFNSFAQQPDPWAPIHPLGIQAQYTPGTSQYDPDPSGTSVYSPPSVAWSSAYGGEPQRLFQTPGQRHFNNFDSSSFTSTQTSPYANGLPEPESNMRSLFGSRPALFSVDQQQSVRTTASPSVHRFGTSTVTSTQTTPYEKGLPDPESSRSSLFGYHSTNLPINRPHQAWSVHEEPIHHRRTRQDSGTGGVRCICDLAFAGCRGSLGKKNEYKRHMKTIHFQPKLWLCRHGGCHDSPQIFDRKDLAKPHLKRTHIISHTNKSEEKRILTEMLDKMEISGPGADPPRYLECSMCSYTFEGENALADRLEHVGKHYEQGLKVPEGHIDWHLAAWGEKQGILERVGERKWRILKSGKEQAQQHRKRNRHAHHQASRQTS